MVGLRGRRLQPRRQHGVGRAVPREQVDRRGQLKQLTGDEREVEVRGAPPVDPLRYQPGVGGDVRQLVEPEARLDVKGTPRYLLVRRLDDDAEGAQERGRARLGGRQVVNDEQFEDPFPDVGEEGRGVDPAGRGADRGDRLVERAGLLKQPHRGVDAAGRLQGLQRGGDVAGLRGERAPLRREGLGVPAQPLQEGAERLRVGDCPLKRRDGDRELGGDRLKGARLAVHGSAYCF